MMLAKAVHGIRNPREVLKEAIGDVLIHGVVLGQNERNIQHAQAVKRHPSSAVGLIQESPGWERCTSIEDPNVVEPQKSAGEHIAPLGIFSVYPPVKVQHQSLE